MRFRKNIGVTSIRTGSPASATGSTRSFFTVRRISSSVSNYHAHVDAALRLFGLMAEELPTKGRMPVRSAHFGRNEISRRSGDVFCEKRSIRADEVTVLAMRDKGLFPGNRN